MLAVSRDIFSSATELESEHSQAPRRRSIRFDFWPRNTND